MKSRIACRPTIVPWPQVVLVATPKTLTNDSAVIIAPFCWMITYELSGLFHVPANCANDGGGGGGDGFHLLESSSSSFPSSGRGAAGGRRASLISLQICTNALFTCHFSRLS